MELVHVATCTGPKFVQIATCTNQPIQVATCTKSQLVYNIYIIKFKVYCGFALALLHWKLHSQVLRCYRYMHTLTVWASQSQEDMYTGDA